MKSNEKQLNREKEKIGYNKINKMTIIMEVFEIISKI
jgi:hypothetical protein